MKKILLITKALLLIIFLSACAATNKINESEPRFDLHAADNAFPDSKYPAAARKRGERGVVIVGVLVLEDGSKGKVELVRSCGFKSLDDAAVHWYNHHGKFLPATKDGKPIAAWKAITVTFTP